MYTRLASELQSSACFFLLSARLRAMPPCLILLPFFLSHIAKASLQLVT